LHIRNIVRIVFAMKIKLTEGQINTPLVVAVGILAAIMLMGIGSHAGFASKSSLQDGYNAGFAAGKKDRINGNDYDSNPPKGHSGAYDENYRHGYDDGWFRGEHHFSSNSAAAASSSAAAAGDDDGGHNHKHKDSAAASSSSSAAAGGGGNSASSSSSAAASSGSAAASSSSAASS
jgi:cobaltochelatase CobN